MAATNNIQRHLPSVLLQIPPLDVSRPYLQQIARDVSNDNVRVQDAGSGKGKGGLKNEVLHAIGPKPPAACPRRQ
eukprot:scaffold57839_cov20-Tisochrysis_lutea.AAC.2